MEDTSVEDTTRGDDPQTQDAQIGVLRCYSRGSTLDCMVGHSESKAKLMRKRAAALELHSELFGVLPPGANIM